MDITCVDTALSLLLTTGTKKLYVLWIVWDVPVKCACEKLNKVHNFFMKA